MKQGQRETRRQVTGKLYIKQTGDSAYVHFGHMLAIAEKFTEQRIDIVEPAKGYLQNTGSILNTIGWAYEAKLNERFAPTLKLLHLGTQSDDVTQALVAAPTGTASFTGVKQGYTYFIGKLNVETVVVKVDTTTMVENTDYKLDKGNGAITIIPDGNIADEDDIAVTFGCAQVKTEVFKPLTEIRKTSDIRIDLFDQISPEPVETHTFNGEYWITDRGNNDGKSINEMTLMILASEKPSVSFASNSISGRRSARTPPQNSRL